MMNIKPVLSKTKIKRVLKDHCGHYIRQNFDDDQEVFRDLIAQVIIEHINDILLYEAKP